MAGNVIEVRVESEDKNQSFSANHMEGNTYQLHIKQKGIGSMTGEFDRKDIIEIVLGLCAMLLNQKE